MNILLKNPLLILLVASSFFFFSNMDLLVWSTFNDDDAHVSQLALSYDWLAPYYRPDVYQQLSIVHFTPLVLSIYKLVLNAFGVNNIAFVVMQIFTISLAAGLAASLCQRITNNLSAGFFCLLLIFSNISLLPMLSRFYTIHYLLGAVLTLLAMLWIHRAVQKKQLHQPLFLLLLGILTFLALLAKEIYIMLIPLLWMIFYRYRALQAGITVTIALLSYFLLRSYILGLSSDGRNGESFLSAILDLKLKVWIDFFHWYITTKWLIIVAMCVAFVRSPRKMLEYTLLASLFAAPALAAPHAFQNPQLHGDRLFFMFDLAIIISSVLIIYSRPVPLKAMAIIMSIILLGLIPLQRQQLETFSKAQINSTTYTINQQLLNHPANNKTIVFTPLNYYQGELMNIYRLLGNPWLIITQNCQYALQLTSFSASNKQPILLAFDNTGAAISRDDLQASCLLSDSSATVTTAPTFDNGLLHWSFTVPAGYTGGVFLIDRGLAIGVGQFQQRLVRPKPQERYQIYTHRNNTWWFSDIKYIKVID